MGLDLGRTTWPMLFKGISTNNASSTILLISQHLRTTTCSIGLVIRIKEALKVLLVKRKEMSVNNQDKMLKVLTVHLVKELSGNSSAKDYQEGHTARMTSTTILVNFQALVQALMVSSKRILSKRSNRKTVGHL
jgi:hypothetical protein